MIDSYFLFLVDLEQDLNGLRKWLHDVESQLLPLCLDSSWTADQLRDKLQEHQVSVYCIISYMLLIGCDHTAYMDYMDLAVCCPQKGC